MNTQRTMGNVSPPQSSCARAKQRAAVCILPTDADAHTDTLCMHKKVELADHSQWSKETREERRRFTPKKHWMLDLARDGVKPLAQAS